MNGPHEPTDEPTDAGDMSVEDLLAAFEVHMASGLGRGEEAALRLLIAHGTWIRRQEFRRHVLIERTWDGPLTAWPGWRELATVPDSSPASGSERAVLRLACSLAGHLPEHPGTEWTLGEILTPLDARNRLLTSRAVALAALGSAAVGPLE